MKNEATHIHFSVDRLVLTTQKALRMTGICYIREDVCHDLVHFS
jgi:hypothetical protein